MRRTPWICHDGRPDAGRLLNGRELDRLPPLLQRLDRRFEHTDDAQAGLAVGQRLPVLPNALQEMLGLDAQPFGQAQLRGPHVARSVADERLIDALLTAFERDALVVDFDFLTWFEVVIHDHLAIAADQGGTIILEQSFAKRSAIVDAPRKFTPD